MAKSKKKVREKSLEDKLLDTAEVLRGNVSPTLYKDITLGLLFLKFISNRYDVRRAEIEKETSKSTEKERKYLLNLKDQYTAKGVFYLKEGDNWDDLAKMASREFCFLYSILMFNAWVMANTMISRGDEYELILE